jgi:hypothetical protein
MFENVADRIILSMKLSEDLKVSFNPVNVYLSGAYLTGKTDTGTEPDVSEVLPVLFKSVI